MGISGGVLWFIILAIGVLIPAQDYRIALGWNPDVSEEDKRAKDLEEFSDKVITKIQPGPVALEPLAKESTKGELSKSTRSARRHVDGTCKGCGQVSGTKKSWCGECRQHQRRSTPAPLAFLLASISYLPLNILILTVLSAWVGGCSVNTGEKRDLRKTVKFYDSLRVTSPEAERDRTRLNYLFEHPGYSAMRGMIVFLIIVSGILIAGGSSFILEGSHSEQLMQYFKLAGIFSFFGYLAGSDPTMFASMIEMGSARLRQPASPPSPTANAAGAAATTAAAATAASAQVTANMATETLDALEVANQENAVDDATGVREP